MRLRDNGEGRDFASVAIGIDAPESKLGARSSTARMVERE